ncbi:hypothetical protein AWJ20_3981 [Sugiyamaella lignohabitans]|uniref:Beta-catenin-like protein 1 N-terminal domain-containing protein n=1 Tax=Sugiyamaella lignohabitans TaxID=796027 RepID=A0A167C3R1_9ASCO|nr:uncharacterized protein AWJ20_3981 [Sugiyamaella lignohabitans]ANB11179.1 hypothetical protein AWJ20_3981 [Sugiyamaella lignohabitans]
MSSTDQIFKVSIGILRALKRVDLGSGANSRQVASGPAPSDESTKTDGFEDDPRFYGNDLESSLQGQVLDYIELKEKAIGQLAGADSFHNRSLLKKVVARFVGARETNETLRVKHPDEPLQFLESEEELFERLKDLTILADVGLYREMSEMDDLKDGLLSLLFHENSDIVVQLFVVLLELLQPDSETDVSSIHNFYRILINGGLLKGIEQYLIRLQKPNQEAQEDDVLGRRVEEEKATLDLLSSLAEIDEFILNFSNCSDLFDSLITRIQNKEPGDLVSENRLSCALIVQSLLSNGPLAKVLITASSVESILNVTSTYIYKDPEPYETDKLFSECVFDVLSSISVNSRDDFLNFEGPELMIKLLRDANWAVGPALRVLKTSVRDDDGRIANLIIESGGLKHLFKLLYKGSKGEVDDVISVLANLLHWLPLESPGRIRVIGKLIEKDYRAVRLLLRKRRKFCNLIGELRSRLSDSALEEKMEIITELEEAGVDKQNRIDIILAWLTVESTRIGRDVIKLLSSEPGNLFQSLRSYISELNLIIRAETEEPAMPKDELEFLRMEEEMVSSLVSQMKHSLQPGYVNLQQGSYKKIISQ